MTDNEKAATFIGWEYHHDADFIKSDGSRVLWRVNIENKFCPDMGDPRNYMKALEGLDRHGIGFWKIEKDTDVESDTCDDVFTVTLVGGVPIQGGCFSEAGKAVISALAALYDVEHPEEKG